MAARSQEALDAVFRALSDTTRRRMLKLLASGDRSVSELAKPHDISLQAISKHVKVLEQAGLVTRLPQGSHQLIQLRTAELRRAAKWLRFYEQFWSAELDALEALLRASPRSRPGRG
jgi:DNA-binding transcriptional ArsR family regulator